MVFSGTKIRLKAATWPAMNDFLPGIFIWCYIQVNLAILIDNDDGILWQNYLLRKFYFECEECYYFPMVLSGKKIRSTTATWSVPNFKWVNWRCYIWIKSANLIEHNHCDIESLYNSNADSRWKTQKYSVCILTKQFCAEFYYSQGLFRNENSSKGRNLTSDELFCREYSSDVTFRSSWQA